MRIRVMVAVTLAVGLMSAGTAAASAEPRTQYHFTAPGVSDYTDWRDDCPAGRQWFRADVNGVGVGWTYTNGGNRCVNVVYGVKTLDRHCDFYFYVPRNHATGIVNFKVDLAPRGGFGGPGLLGINEEPVSGWEYIGSGRLVESLTFGDDNGQAYKSKKLGWGMDAEHGIKQVCKV